VLVCIGVVDVDVDALGNAGTNGRDRAVLTAL
jgi:hypothetical protein